MMYVLQRRSPLVKINAFKLCVLNNFSKKRDVKPEDWQIRKMKSRLKSETEVEVKDYDMSKLRSGLVIERQSEKLLVQLTDDIPHSHVDILCSQKSHLVSAQIVTGDRVHLSIDDSGSGVVVNVDERRNVLQRPAKESNVHKLKMKPIASNIDQLLVVVASSPKVPNSVLDRYIVAAHSYDIPKIIIVINKFDLEGAESLALSMAHYTTLGYTIVRSSTEAPGGLDQLKSVLSDKTSIFMGQSGVGKSSLINCILPDANIKTGELVSKRAVGAHTTSNARLYHLPSGGKLIDAPGIRDLGTWHLDRSAILEGFIEIRKHAQNCKFRNCKHSEAESKHCGVQAALAEGLIQHDRFKSFVEMNIS